MKRFVVIKVRNCSYKEFKTMAMKLLTEKEIVEAMLAKNLYDIDRFSIKNYCVIERVSWVYLEVI